MNSHIQSLPRYLGWTISLPQFFFNALPKFSILIDSVKVADGWLDNVNDNNEFDGHCSQAVFFGNKLLPADTVNFSIATTSDYTGSVVKEIAGERLISSSAKLTFESDEYLTTCAKLTNYKELSGEL